MNAVIRIEYFSDCTGVNPPLKSEATFPVMQGNVLTVTCEAGHILSGYDKITCSHHKIFNRDNEVYNPSCSELILEIMTNIFILMKQQICTKLTLYAIKSLSFISRPL